MQVNVTCHHSNYFKVDNSLNFPYQNILIATLCLVLHSGNALVLLLRSTNTCNTHTQHSKPLSKYLKKHCHFFQNAHLFPF